MGAAPRLAMGEPNRIRSRITQSLQRADARLSQTMPISKAFSTARVRSRTPSFDKMFET